MWVGSSNDHGIKQVYIRTDAASAIWFDAAVDRVADGLRLLGDGDSKDVRRGKAVAVLAQPQAALDLFERAAARDAGMPESGAPGESRLAEFAVRGRHADPRPPATLYVHVPSDLLTGDASVARVEGVGAVVGDQVRDWLMRCDITVKPVLDLAGQTPVDAYEVPDRMREAVVLRSPVSVFPWASTPARSCDQDHTDTYVAMPDDGPRGQTRTANLGPLGRRSHRLKTHGKWRLWQVDDGVFVWRSPSGRYYAVDHAGTHRIAARRSRAPASAPALN